MDIMYIVKYSGGEWDDYYTSDIFVTSNKEVAEKYVEKFNNILKKWKEYYSQFAGDYGSIKEEYIEMYDRFYSLKGINKCYFKEIEIR
jgi:Fe-S oxidoreductase